MTLTVLGVPDSAGAYCVGVERAPAALREAGLIQALAADGRDVRDAGDLSLRRWVPDRERPLVQNLDDEIAAVRELAEAAGALLSPDGTLLVLGGSCTVAVGVCAAIAGQGEQPRVVYLDRHLDLNTPDTTDEGSLSWMGVAHCLAVEGAAMRFADATGLAPLITPADLVYLGVDLAQTTAGERARLAELDLAVVSQAELVAHPQDAARAARRSLPTGASFVVHLDVDVLDFIDAPLAENVNGRNSGPTLEQLQEALTVLWQDPDCRVVSIAQLDPAHAASDPTVLDRFVAVLAAAAPATT